MKKLTKLPAVLLSLIFILLLASGSSVLGGVGIREEPKSDLYILSIGIDKYTSSRLGNLRFAAVDAVALANEFEKRAKNKGGTVKKLVLLDAQASRQGILDALETLSREMNSEDVMIFNFSGYGNEIATANLKSFYLFPSNVNFDAMDQTSISAELLQAYFRRIRAGKKLIIMDSCKSALGYKSAESAFIEQDHKISRLFTENVLFVGTDTNSFEDAEDGHGTITKIVLDGLKGEADFDGDGIVRSRELEAHIYKGGIKYATERYRDFHPRTITLGMNFDLAYTDKKLEQISAVKKEGETKNTAIANRQADPVSDQTRAENVSIVSAPKEEVRRGEDYALLFANDSFDDRGWSKLKNPQNDANDIAKELEERYHFKKVEIKRNLTTQEIYDTIETYKAAEFANKKEDQLFVFFAGHGVADKISDTASSGYYVGRDSPYPFTPKRNGEFVQLDRLLTVIDQIELDHVMVVFDACFAGQVWKPGLQLIKETAWAPGREEGPFTTAVMSRPSADNSIVIRSASFDRPNAGDAAQTQLSPHAYAKRLMKSRSRRVITSGDKPVLDSWKRADGTLSNNSPFADAFLRALRTGGGEDRVLSNVKIAPFIDKLTPEPEAGRLSGSDGAFVFVSEPKK